MKYGQQAPESASGSPTKLTQRPHASWKKVESTCRPPAQSHPRAAGLWPPPLPVKGLWAAALSRLPRAQVSRSARPQVSDASALPQRAIALSIEGKANESEPGCPEPAQLRAPPQPPHRAQHPRTRGSAPDPDGLPLADVWEVIHFRNSCCSK